MWKKYYEVEKARTGRGVGCNQSPTLLLFIIQLHVPVDGLFESNKINHDKNPNRFAVKIITGLYDDDSVIGNTDDTTDMPLKDILHQSCSGRRKEDGKSFRKTLYIDSNIREH
jgi:hypothetical protein